MAVVFISPKQKQRMFLIGIISAVALFLIIIASIIFFSQPKEIPLEMVFNRPKINIDFSVFDSEEFKDLEPFIEMEVQFLYIAEKDGEEMEGYISSTSLEEAKKTLEDSGYEVRKIEESKIGRDNPFENYDTSVPDDIQKILENTQTE